jgi:hypothetical protein
VEFLTSKKVIEFKNVHGETSVNVTTDKADTELKDVKV